MTTALETKLNMLNQIMQNNYEKSKGSSRPSTAGVRAVHNLGGGKYNIVY